MDIPLAITPVYAGFATLLYVVLSFRVIGVRRRERIGLGDGDSMLLRRRMRAHGNFAEYAPLGLLLMAMAELQGAGLVAIHMMGALLLVGRAAHAYGISRHDEESLGRVAGMVLTFAALIIGAVANLALALI